MREAGLLKTKIFWHICVIESQSQLMYEKEMGNLDETNSNSG